VDGIHFDRWTLAGSFTLLSSNRVTVGGYDMMRPLPGIKGVSNFVGCLRKVFISQRQRTGPSVRN
jgi:neurexin